MSLERYIPTNIEYYYDYEPMLTLSTAFQLENGEIYVITKRSHKYGIYYYVPYNYWLIKKMDEDFSFIKGQKGCCAKTLDNLIQNKSLKTFKAKRTKTFKALFGR